MPMFQQADADVLRALWTEVKTPIAKRIQGAKIGLALAEFLENEEQNAWNKDVRTYKEASACGNWHHITAPIPMGRIGNMVRRAKCCVVGFVSP